MLLHLQVNFPQWVFCTIRRILCDILFPFSLKDDLHREKEKSTLRYCIIMKVCSYFFDAEITVDSSTQVHRTTLLQFSSVAFNVDNLWFVRSPKAVNIFQKIFRGFRISNKYRYLSVPVSSYNCTLIMWNKDVLIRGSVFNFYLLNQAYSKPPLKLNSKSSINILKSFLVFKIFKWLSNFNSHLGRFDLYFIPEYKSDIRN